MTITSLQRKRGVVIIVALFVVALVAAISFAMMARLARDTGRTQLILRTTQAELLAQGSLAWAREKLRDNFIKQKPDRVVDKIPIESEVNTVQGYEIKSTIYDMQSRYNINNLEKPENEIPLQRLFQAVLPEYSEEQIIELMAAIFDWITPTSQNKFNDYYLSRPIPYRVAHRSLVSISELRLVKGITPKVYSSLLPYLIALPEQTPVNVQTAPAQVLLTTSPNLPLEVAAVVVAQRKEKPILKVEDYKSLEILKPYKFDEGKDGKKESMTTISTYFLVVTEIKIEKQKILLYTLLRRNADQGNPTINTVWQSKGSW